MIRKIIVLNDNGGILNTITEKIKRAMSEKVNSNTTSYELNSYEIVSI